MERYVESGEINKKGVEVDMRQVTLYYELDTSWVSRLVNSIFGKTFVRKYECDDLEIDNGINMVICERAEEQTQFCIPFNAYLAHTINYDLAGYRAGRIDRIRGTEIERNHLHQGIQAQIMQDMAQFVVSDEPTEDDIDEIEGYR